MAEKDTKSTKASTKSTAAKATDTVKTAAPKTAAPKTAAPKTTTAPKAAASAAAELKANAAAATTPAKEKFSIKKVIEKYSNSRGSKPTIVGEMKKNKAQSNRQAAAASRSEAMARARDPQRVQQGLLWALIALLIASLASGLVLSFISAADTIANRTPSTPFVNNYPASQMVGYYAKQLGTVDRYKPVEGLHNQGLSAKGYPKYGSTLNLTSEEKTAIILENRKLTANGTWVDASKKTTGTYDKMDQYGYLYTKNGDTPPVDVPERLYQHTGSVGLYGGNVADNEQAVIKQFTIRPRSYGGYYSVTGLYAPAGEVIKVEISDADMKATSGLTIHIGQALYNGQANNIWEQRGMNRMPIVLNTMNITTETATYNEETGTWTGYVGSFLGGPIYVGSKSATFTVTISGGVNYAHFILGVTTESEYSANMASSAPYFDLEVWDRGVLHSGPKRQAVSFGYDAIYKAAVLWEKVSLVTTSVSNQGVVFIYDPFVAAGAAVAFPGRRSVNCPESWMKQSLNYTGLVNGGSWGNFHEYHHNFQDYGLGSGADGEVTNNGLNLVSYSLFTKISSNRSIGSYGGAGLSGWNQYTVAPWALNRVNNGAITSTNGLAIYATLLHNFGQDQYTKARGARGSAYLNKWATNTHQDFTYFAAQVRSYGFQGGGNYVPSAAVQEANYPLFVPVSSVYQTGRTYNYDGEKREITTMQPYVITYGQPFTVDLNPYTVNSSGQYESGSVVIGNGFTYRIKNVNSAGVNGTFKETDKPGVYVFTPNQNNNLQSGKIYVTLEITTTDGAHEWNGHKLDDVDLILEFESTHEKNKSVLERTTYTYEPSNMYFDAEQAYNAGFKGYTSAQTINHTNPTQNCNTDVWFVPDTDAGHSKFPNAKEHEIAVDNTIVVIEGKLYFEEEGRYRIYLRGRKNCAVYYSKDGKTYEKGATIKDTTIPKTSAYFRPDDPCTYFDLDMGKDSWLYFKEILIVENAKASGTSYIGLGVKQWQTPMFTVQEKYYDAYGNEVSEDDPNKDDSKTVTKYYNYLGVEVSAEEASKTDPIAPTINNNSQPYVNAYRTSYEKINNEFVTDYFYTRSYTYSYNNNSLQSAEQTVISGNYNEKSARNWSKNEFPIEYLTDGDKNTYIHTNNYYGTREDRPLQLVLDLGEAKPVNRMIIYCRVHKAPFYATAFKLEVSLDNVEWTTIGDYADMKASNYAVTVNFDETTFRYYRLTFIGSSGDYLTIAEIEMWRVFEISGGKHLSPNDKSLSYYGDWHMEQAFSYFGQVVVGERNATLKFEFEGARLGLIVSKSFGADYEVTIDGVVVSSVSQIKPLDEVNGAYGLAFLSDVLSEGKHVVEIKCRGQGNIDSVIIFPHTSK